MRVRLWDRLLDREADPPPSGPVPIGRYVFVDAEQGAPGGGSASGRRRTSGRGGVFGPRGPSGGRDLSLAGRRVRSGDHLVAIGDWTLWDEDRRQATHGACDPCALPDEVTERAVLGVAAGLERLGVEPAGRWLRESPLLGDTEIGPRLRRRRMDDEIAEHLDALRAVCHDPADRLRVVNRLVPVGLARRITPATITRLAGHSEDWNRLRPDGVEPKVVLASSREQNLDFYENRVAARLVDHLWGDVVARLNAVARIDEMFSDLDRYVADAVDRPWRQQGKLFDLIEGVVANETWKDLAAVRRKELGAVRDALVALRGGGVLPGVNRQAEIGTALRATNLFVNEGRYRRVRDLWQAWVNDRTGRDREDAPSARIQDWCRGFTVYTGLLLLHALDHLGLLGKPVGSDGPAGAGGASPFTRGGPPIRLGTGDVAATGTAVTLAWLPTEVFEVAVGGRAVLRVLALPHALTGHGRTSATRDETQRLITEKPVIPTLIVYPGTFEERQALPERLRLEVFSGCDSPVPWRRGGVGLLPISPMEIDSVVRLARSLYSVLARERHRDHPLSIRCRQAYAREVGDGADWLRAEETGLLVTRPPAPGELAAARARLQSLRARVAGRPDGAGEAELLDRVADELTANAESLAEYTRCPVCLQRRPDPWRAYRSRRDGTYSCECPQGHARWELRRCASCTRPYPVINAAPVPEGVEFDGDGVDRLLGSHVVSMPCRLRPSVFLCPSCGTCGVAFDGKGSGCRRCCPEGRDVATGRAAES
ncbi:hypothetical protein [Streptosporangium sp. H16]|uniref:hypothetical protein n=1 Tax=Streptosporangium sp. H16 TaxID=3444184 RepID=UPI003F794FDD